jgi:hypothetical protein
MIICVSRSFSGAIGLHRPDCAPYPALPVNVIQRRRGRKRRRVSKHAPSPLAGVCNGRVWNAPSIPQKMLGASSTCPLQTDTKPWSRSGLGEVGEGDWSVGRASRCGIALRLRVFLSRKAAKARRRCWPEPSYCKAISGMTHLSPEFRQRTII